MSCDQAYYLPLLRTADELQCMILFYKTEPQSSQEIVTKNLNLKKRETLQKNNAHILIPVCDNHSFVDEKILSLKFPNIRVLFMVVYSLHRKETL